MSQLTSGEVLASERPGRNGKGRYGLRRAGTRESTVAAGRADNKLRNPRNPARGGAPGAGEGSEPAHRG